jgi:acetyl-CoA synthetase
MRPIKSVGALENVHKIRGFKMSNETAGRDVLADDKRLYLPPRELVENSNVMQWLRKKGFKTEAEMRTWTGENFVEFWDEMAKTYADWFEPYKSTLEWKPPYARWFVGGKCNVAYNAVERHANSWRRNKVAYIFVGEPVGDVRKITYFELNREINKFANALKSVGVKKGDRVGIYLPMIPALPIANAGVCQDWSHLHRDFLRFFSRGRKRPLGGLRT